MEEAAIVRTHDEFYAHEDPKAKPKDVFKFISNRIANYKKTVTHPLAIADIGCAAGAFPSYLDSLFPGDSVHGFEYLDSLLQTARENFPNTNFKQSSLLDKHAILKQAYDVITLVGVLSIFDDVEPAINNLLYWTKPTGKIFIHGLFNPYDVDVFIKYRKPEDYGKNEFESGWNIISQKTIQNILEKNQVADITFHPFEISTELHRKPDDSLRSWTEKNERGTRIITNGLCINQPQYILEITR
jgi:2-polyprenyl-3-methyl-5-hydroxy-6-metoxy-1,4-benzoquinol methylase